MKKVFLFLVITTFISGVFTSCVPEDLTNKEDEDNIILVDPANDGTIDEEDHREEDD